MSAALPNPSICLEDALNALAEIRACHDELRTFLADTFDRLDEVVSQLQNRGAALKPAETHLDRDVMQEQIDYLTRLVTDLAQTVNKRERTPAEQNLTELSKAKT